MNDIPTLANALRYLRGALPRDVAQQYSAWQSLHSGKGFTDLAVNPDALLARLRAELSVYPLEALTEVFA